MAVRRLLAVDPAARALGHQRAARPLRGCGRARRRWRRGGGLGRDPPCPAWAGGDPRPEADERPEPRRLPRGRACAGGLVRDPQRARLLLADPEPPPADAERRLLSRRGARRDRGGHGLALAAHRGRIRLSAINSGFAQRRAASRGRSTFSSIADYPYAAWRRKRARGERVVELAVAPGVPDIAAHTRRVVRMRAATNSKRSGRGIERPGARPTRAERHGRGGAASPPSSTARRTGGTSSMTFADLAQNLSTNKIQDATRGHEARSSRRAGPNFQEPCDVFVRLLRVIPALMTPCKPDRTPDFDALVACGQRMIAAGMSAVVYCGSMGDWPLLTDAQRMEGVERLVKGRRAGDRRHRRRQHASAVATPRTPPRSAPRA